MFIESDVTSVGSVWPTTPDWPVISQIEYFDRYDMNLNFACWRYLWESMINGELQRAYFTFPVPNQINKITEPLKNIIFNQKNVERIRQEVKDIFEDKALRKGRYGNRKERRTTRR